MRPGARPPRVSFAFARRPCECLMMQLAEHYHRFILWIGDGTGLPDAMLHLHAGMVILLIARIVTGRSLGSFVPLSIVAAAEGANELLDRLSFGAWRWPDTLGDVANTLLWPTVICVAVRLRPLIADRHPAIDKTVTPRAWLRP